MKYRIVKHGDWYVPQFRWAFIWWGYEEGYADSPVIRSSLEEAEEFILDMVKAKGKYKTKEIVKKFEL